jgi:hypothetical protein
MPQAIEIIFLLLSLVIGRGAEEKTVPPNPRDPKFPLPNEYNVP